jgi:C4-dicarboxylate transporter, DctM subunit
VVTPSLFPEGMERGPGGEVGLTWILNVEGIASGAASFLVANVTSRWLLLIGINILLIAAGLFLDAISIFYTFLPVLLPVIRAFGIDPVHFGVIMTVNLAIGQVTPPVGVNLITAAGISGADLRTVARASLPFIASEFVALTLITFIPQLSLFLPGFL